MAAIELYMVEGDTAPSRQFTIKRDDTAVDLTGATVKLIIRDTSTFNNQHWTPNLYYRDGCFWNSPV